MTEIQYPIDIVATAIGEFRASWADFPDIAACVGADPAAALRALVESSLDRVADAVAQGNAPPPSVANERPVVSFGATIRPTLTHHDHLIGVTRSGTGMTTYSWTNNIAYFE